MAKKKLSAIGDILGDIAIAVNALNRAFNGAKHIVEDDAAPTAILDELTQRRQESLDVPASPPTKTKPFILTKTKD